MTKTYKKMIYLYFIQKSKRGELNQHYRILCTNRLKKFICTPTYHACGICVSPADVWRTRTPGNGTMVSGRLGTLSNA